MELVNQFNGQPLFFIQVQHTVIRHHIHQVEELLPWHSAVT